MLTFVSLVLVAVRCSGALLQRLWSRLATEEVKLNISSTLRASRRDVARVSLTRFCYSTGFPIVHFYTAMSLLPLFPYLNADLTGLARELRGVVTILVPFLAFSFVLTHSGCPFLKLLVYFSWCYLNCLRKTSRIWDYRCHKVKMPWRQR